MNGRALSTKQAAAILLVAGLSIVLYVQYRRGAFSSKPGAATRAAAEKPAAVEELPRVVEVTLEQPPPEPIRKDSRNLFNYARSPEEIQAERDAQLAEERRLKEEAEMRRKQMEEEARLAVIRAAEIARNPPPPPAPPINFRFLGKMGDARAPLAILEETSAAGEKYVVREGEVILDKYKVLKIEFDSVTIGFSDATVAKNPTWAHETKTIKMGS